MKFLNRMGLVFIALCIMLSVVCFASAAPFTERQDIKSFLEKLPVGMPEDFDSSNMPHLKEYPKVVDALSEMLLDLKVDSGDFDDNANSLFYKLVHWRIHKNVLVLASPYKNMMLFLSYTAPIYSCKLTSGYSVDKAAYGLFHFCYMTVIRDNNGNEKVCFYWVDKENCKYIVKKMMENTFDIKENPFAGDKFKNDDPDLMFLKYTQDAAIKYFGDIDSFFNDDELSTSFFRTMFEVITDNGRSPGNDKKMISIVSSDRSEAVKDYKKLGQSIIKKAFAYKGKEEGKDYEIEYDDGTGYIKNIKKSSSDVEKSGISSVSENSNSAYSQLMNNVLIVVCIFLAVITIAVVVILIVVLSKRKR